MNVTPSSQITSDIIIQSTIKSLERLVMSKHEAFVSSLSIYEDMLQRLDRTLKMHENFMASKQEAFNSSLDSYQLVLDQLKQDITFIETRMNTNQEAMQALLTCEDQKLNYFSSLLDQFDQSLNWVYWLVGSNALLTLAVLIRMFLK